VSDAYESPSLGRPGQVDPLTELDKSLDDAQLAAVDHDLLRRLALTAVRTDLLVAWLQDDPGLVAAIDPVERAAVVRRLDQIIAKTEAQLRS
jgi:hypothetical protein